ncbi:MAG TPA: hypothetical protein VD993_00735 [Chitinophagaceae bacterium]|nr:hypothetical protein [Chitinophagaceae bacterium]
MKQNILLVLGCVFCCILLVISCRYPTYRHKVGQYLNADDSVSKVKYMANNYRSYFKLREGTGKNREESLKGFKNWDGALNPDVKITSFSRVKDTVTVHFVEQNDFSKLIDYPGWRGTEVITFDNSGLITEMIYIPDTTNPPYRSWLAPALDWLQQHEPDSLALVYKDNRLVQTEYTAKLWTRLLKRWRAATGRRPG